MKETYDHYEKEMEEYRKAFDHIAKNADAYNDFDAAWRATREAVRVLNALTNFKTSRHNDETADERLETLTPVVTDPKKGGDLPS